MRQSGTSCETGSTKSDQSQIPVRKWRHRPDGSRHDKGPLRDTQVSFRGPVRFCGPAPQGEHCKGQLPFRKLPVSGEHAGCH